MGLGLAALTAITLLLPGIAFVLGLTRLYNQSVPATALEQHFSIGLIISIVAALAFHAAALPIAAWVAIHSSLPAPEPSQIIFLLAGVVDKPGAEAAIASVRDHTTAICLYFIIASLAAWRIGKLTNYFLPNRIAANWFDLLKPDSGADFVVMTTDIVLGDHCHLFTGVVKDFNIAKDGALSRVVLFPAAKKVLHAAGTQLTATSPKQHSTFSGPGWIDIPGEFLILQMESVRTVNLDYWFVDAPPRRDTFATRIRVIFLRLKRNIKRMQRKSRKKLKEQERG